MEMIISFKSCEVIYMSQEERFQEVLNQLNKLSGSLKNQLSGLFNKAQSEGWFDKIINFIKSLFNRVEG